MAYDEALAERIRELVAGEPGLTEKKMFGGLAFLVGDALVAKTDARLFEMRGRELQGWLRVDDGHVHTKRRLEKWVKIGAAYARSLPPKR